MAEAVKKVKSEEGLKEEGIKMSVLSLSIELTRLNPIFDSEKIKEEGKLYRYITVETRSGRESVIRIDESVEGKYEILSKFNKLKEELGEELVDIIEMYCQTPVVARLSR